MNSMQTDKVYPSIVGVIQHLGDGVSWLAVRNLGSVNAARSFRALLESLEDTRGLILDLRDTREGDFEVGVECAALFMWSGKVWSFQRSTWEGPISSQINLTPNCFEWLGRYPRRAPKRCTWFRLQPVLAKTPIIVLQNGASSPAAEVLSHALKNNDRAAIWGTATKGQGVPAKYFACSGSTVLRLVHSRAQDVGGEAAEEVSTVPGCEPTTCVEATDSFDKELVAKAKAKLVSFISKTKSAGNLG